MSNALALAAVSAVLRDLLDTGMIDHSVPDVLGPVTISSVAPDTIDLTGTGSKPRLNLFLHQVTPNAAWRNMGLPARDARGGRTGEVPLALDLHYVVTAYGVEDFQAEVLLGYAMQLLHETPVLARDAIRTALAPTSPVTGSLLPALYHALRAADLADQVEQIRITPVTMNTEEMSRLWSALQAHYRPSASYQVSVVLIDSGRAQRSVQPVLTRNITAVPGMVPPLPFIDRVLPPDGQPAARQGDVVELAGVYLEGTGREVEISSSRLGVRRTITAAAGGGHDLLPFVVPADPAGVPAGVYRVSARVIPRARRRPAPPTSCPWWWRPRSPSPFSPPALRPPRWPAPASPWAARRRCGPGSARRSSWASTSPWRPPSRRPRGPSPSASPACRRATTWPGCGWTASTRGSSTARRCRRPTSPTAS